MIHSGRQTGRDRHRPGYSLIELMIAVGASTVLMGGMASALLISNRALDVPEGQSGRQLDAGLAQQDLLSDLQHAVAFTERTAHAVTFQVPDRDGDGDLETIRYAWSGTVGDPITYEHNGSSPLTLVDDVHQFDLSYLTQTLTAPVVVEDEGSTTGNLLFVSGGKIVEPSWLSKLAGETAYVEMTAVEEGFVKLFESWGYNVTQVSLDQNDDVLQKALDTADVVYVSAEPSTADGHKLLFYTPLGVVNSQIKLTSMFGFSSGLGGEIGAELTIVNDQHYVTETFAAGKMIQVLQNKRSLYWLSEAVTKGITELASFNGPSLVALEAGIEDFNGQKVPGRRLQLPWGDPELLPSDLTGDGQFLLQRALEWAAGAGTEVVAPAPEDPVVEVPIIEETPEVIIQDKSRWRNR